MSIGSWFKRQANHVAHAVESGAHVVLSTVSHVGHAIGKHVAHTAVKVFNVVNKKIVQPAVNIVQHKVLQPAIKQLQAITHQFSGVFEMDATTVLGGGVGSLLGGGAPAPPPPSDTSTTYTTASGGSTPVKRPFMQRLETSAMEPTVLAATAAGAAAGYLGGGDSRLMLGIAGGVIPVVAHAALVQG